MAKGQSGSALRYLRVLLAEGTATGQTDGQLLERFVRHRADSAESGQAAATAFEVLVDRHGPMVWGVCRRVLRDSHEAEDAFQATFLVLVRKAGQVRVDGSLGRWLYGVAHRVARRARSEAERRGSDPGPGLSISPNDPAAEVERRDLGDAVSEEVDRLPAKYRPAIELCYLQGLTYEQAAVQLDWPLATVKSRLTRGRTRLRERLARRGLAFAAPGLAPVVPKELASSTVRVATSSAAGALPAAVSSLTEGVMRMMVWEKFGSVAAGALVVIGLTAGALAQQASKDGVPGARATRADARPAEKSEGQFPTDPRWVQIFPNGATIEVVGISPHPSGPGTWWRPDGTPLDRPSCDPSTTIQASDRDVVPRTIVVRITGVPEGAAHDWWVDQAEGGSQGSARVGGQAVPELRQLVTSFPRGLKTSSVQFDVAAGPWQTVQTWGMSSGAVGNRDGTSFIFGEPIATAKGTVLSVTHDISGQSVRLVATDDEGREHPAEIRSGSGVRDFHKLVGEFDVPPAQIKEFRVQTRPFERVKVEGIALDPSARK